MKTAPSQRRAYCHFLVVLCLSCDPWDVFLWERETEPKNSVKKLNINLTPKNRLRKSVEIDQNGYRRGTGGTQRASLPSPLLKSKTK